MTRRVAIVGAGPSGFYTAEALLDSGLAVETDVIDRLPTPYGLVRYGIAPDHQKLKAIAATFSEIARRDGFRFVGNVTVGRDVALDELRAMYDAVVLAYGAGSPKSLDVPGERLPGVHTADAFVAWYNGRPDAQDARFDLSQESVVIVGHGNVALDVCRILSKTPDALRGSDIPRPVRDALAESRVADIHLVGRRGPNAVKFTRKVLRELGQLSDAHPVVDPSDLCCEADDPAAKALVELLKCWSTSSRTARKRIHFHFRARPVAFDGRGRLQRVVFERDACACEAPATAKTPAERLALPCGLAFTSVGYRGVALDGVRFDCARGVVPNEAGRVEPGLYVSGWLKRGASGVVGTNRACGEETAAAVLADLSACSEEKPGFARLAATLRERGIRTVSFADWLRIDDHEVRAGQPHGRPREKFVTTAAMLAAIDGPRAPAPNHSTNQREEMTA